MPTNQIKIRTTKLLNFVLYLGLYLRSLRSLRNSQDKMLKKNILLVAGVSELCELLQNPSLELSRCIYSDRIAIKHSMIGNTNVVRMWKTQSFFDMWYDDFESAKFVAAIDYEVKPDYLKIEYMNINDGFDSMLDTATVNSTESRQLNTALIMWIKTIAKEEKKPKVIIDVHQNTKIFDKYYHCEGFRFLDKYLHNVTYVF